MISNNNMHQDVTSNFSSILTLDHLKKKDYYKLFWAKAQYVYMSVSVCMHAL